ncbi:MAG: DUF2141 domain-containing protein [Bacteriovorax sp.]|nr:DUF2141 domain-containing protein [Rhizobacter sp.]
MNPGLTLRTLAPTLLLLSFGHVVQAQVCAQVEVQGLTIGQGMLMIASYADEASFRKSPVATLKVEPTTETLQVQVCGFTGRAAAFTIYQDLNGNGTLDTNPFGVPIEPWGASGKPSALAPPTWGTTQVPLDGSTVVVKLIK